MDKLLSNIKIQIPEGVYLKDPESSTLGKKILEKSIEMIAEIGFEEFNFKKLGLAISSNESSIYRYFENKHMLLIYLVSWYWGWIEYKLVIETFSIKETNAKLLKAINIITGTITNDGKFEHINEVLLNQIVIHENPKSYLTKEVDSENVKGFFLPFKRVVLRLSEIISEGNPEYKFPESLASTIVEGSIHQHYSRLHLKSITSCNNSATVNDFFIDLILKVIGNEK